MISVLSLLSIILAVLVLILVSLQSGTPERPGSPGRPGPGRPGPGRPGAGGPGPGRPGPGGPQPRAPTRPGPSRPFLRFEKTPCFGTCPVYTVVMDNRGEGTFSGQMNTETKGDAPVRISPRRVRDILSRAEEIGFWTMKDTYDANITDIPSTILTLDHPVLGRKKVVARADFPQRLGNFLDWLENIWESEVKIT